MAEWITLREVARIWGVHPDTARRYVSRGIICKPRQFRYRRDDGKPCRTRPKWNRRQVEKQLQAYLRSLN